MSEHPNRNYTHRNQAADRRPMGKRGGSTGHDKLLKNLLLHGGRISVYLMNGEMIVDALVVASDRYTISVRQGMLNPRIIFKHAIVEFIVTNPGIKPVDPQ